MQIYHTQTKEDCGALMVELDKKGAKWNTGKKATDFGIWDKYKEHTCIFLEENIMTYAGIDFYKEFYPEIPIETYKAKQNYETLKQATNEALSSNHDNVNSPKYYTNGERETIEIIRDILGSEGFQDFCVGNIIKRVFKYKDKNSLEDIQEAGKYIDFLEDELEINQK